MQCPRCGLQNQPGISACARCGLPVYLPSPGDPYARPPGGQTPPAGGGSPPYPPGATPTQQAGGRPQSSPPLAGGPRPEGPTVLSPHPGYAPSGNYPPQGGYPGPPAPGAAGGPGSAPPAGSAPSGSMSQWATRAAVALAALLCLGYALWAFTARRGIFGDFASGRTVGVSAAEANDRIDTSWLIIAGVVTLVALALWLVHRLGRDTERSLLDVGGLVLAGLGTVVVVAGLVLAGRVSAAADSVSAGDRGVTASLVTGSGFMLLGVGLVLGLVALSRHPTAPTVTSSATVAGSYPGW
jgi:hypothetical protein